MRRARGMTLIELLAVLAIAGILIAVAAPDMRAMILSYQLRAATNDLFESIALTRALAVARNQRVKMIPAGPDADDWTRGWTVFVDRDGDRVAGPADEVISVHGPLAQGIAANFAFTTSAAPYYIAYNGAGRSCSDTNSAAARLGTLSLFHGGQVRRIKINMLGRARVCNPARDKGCEGAAGP